MLTAAWTGFGVALCLLGSDSMAAEVHGTLVKDNSSTVGEQENETGNGFPFQSINLKRSLGAVLLRKSKIVFKDCGHKTQLFLNIFG